VKQTISRIDVDVPAAYEYQMNYVSEGGASVVTRPTSTTRSQPRPSSTVLRAQDVNIRVEEGVVLLPPPSTNQITAKIENSPVLRRPSKV